MVKFQDWKSCKKHGSYHANECLPWVDEKVSKVDYEKCPECNSKDFRSFITDFGKKARVCMNCSTLWELPAEEVDNINHPPHYNSGKAKCECGRKLECIDVTRHMSFNVGNAVKHVWRFEHKNGVEDLKKAIWYLQDQVKKLEREKAHLA